MATTKSSPALETAARAGFSGATYDPRQHGMQTSDCHAAFIVGQRIRFLAGSLPTGVRKGRGDTVHANGHLWRVNFAAGTANTTN
jgi:hypothetical protein